MHESRVLDDIVKKSGKLSAKDWSFRLDQAGHGGTGESRGDPGPQSLLHEGDRPAAAGAAREPVLSHRSARPVRARPPEKPHRHRSHEFSRDRSRLPEPLAAALREK